MEIISKELRKVYKSKNGLLKSRDIEVIKDFTYTIKQGEIIALMGVNNSGKSTLVNLLSARDLPTSGKIYVDGEVNYKKLKDSSEIINGFNNKKVISNESVYNNIVYYGEKLKINNLDIEKRINELRDIFELDKILAKKVNELNELDLAKVNIVISMIGNPLVLFFDSALSDFEATVKTVVLKMLKRLNKEFKTTIIIASDDVMDIEKICKRITVIKEGSIVVDDDFEKVKKNYLNKKNVSITFNKRYNAPKGEFEIIESSDYFLKIKIDFNKCDFASLINQFDVNTIIDINITGDSLTSL